MHQFINETLKGYRVTLKSYNSETAASLCCQRSQSIFSKGYIKKFKKFKSLYSVRQPLIVYNNNNNIYLLIFNVTNVTLTSTLYKH